MDINEIMQIYDRFIEILEEFSMPPQEQIKKLHGTVVADELATDFSDIAFAYAEILKENHWINQEQFHIMEVINNMLDEMSEDSNLWDENALIYSKEWKDCRHNGKRLLDTLISS